MNTHRYFQRATIINIYACTGLFINALPPGLHCLGTSWKVSDARFCLTWKACLDLRIKDRRWSEALLSMHECIDPLLDGESVKAPCVRALRKIYVASKSKRPTSELKPLA